MLYCRTTVTMPPVLLQSAGPIRYQRGHIQIVDRAALENISCECYGVIRHNTDKVFATPAVAGGVQPDASAGTPYAFVSSLSRATR
jgi:hypothetical protein